MSDEPTGEATGTEGATEAVDTTTTEATAPDTGHFDRITSRMDELAQSTQSQAEMLAQLYERINAEPEEPAWEPDPSDPDYEEQMAQQALQAFIDEQVNAKVQEALTPFQQQQQERQWLDNLTAVEQKYPDLRDASKAQPAIDAATGLASRLGIDVHHPDFAALVETAYLAQRAQSIAAGETPAGSTTASLEGGGGAAPTNQQEEDPQERFIKNTVADGSSVWK